MSTVKLSRADMLRGMNELLDHCNTLDDSALRELAYNLNAQSLNVVDDETYEYVNAKCQMVFNLLACRELQDEIDALKDRQDSEMEYVQRQLLKFAAADS